MAYYCVKCGRKLPDGAICPCRIRRGVPQQEGGQPGAGAGPQVNEDGTIDADAEVK